MDMVHRLGDSAPKREAKLACVRIHDIEATTIEGQTVSLSEFAGKAVLVVNVASKCGFTPQYEGLQKLYDTYRDAGLVVLGFPCNQFLFQEPASEDKIASFCSTTYGVTFPMFSKVKVNGRGRHPLYEELTKAPDASGKAGRVGWNFEKFLVSVDGEVVGRFRKTTKPDAPELVAAIEAQLPRKGEA
jgi:glutathione peroxidase